MVVSLIKFAFPEFLGTSRPGASRLIDRSGLFHGRLHIPRNSELPFQGAITANLVSNRHDDAFA